MTKQELIRELAKSDIIQSRDESISVYNHFINIIVTTLASGDSVDLGKSVGSFKITNKPARSGVVAGRPYNSPAKNVVHFRPSSALKSAVAGN